MEVDRAAIAPQNDSSPFFVIQRDGTLAISKSEVLMPAYLLLIAALLSRVIPHSGWFGFTAVGASLLYFGARQVSNGKTGRGWWQICIPVVALAAADYYLTTRAYGYAFAWREYVVTWAWYAIAILMGNALLAKKVSVLRVGSATLLGPTTFFLLSNFAAWLVLHFPGSIYAPNFNGILACYAAGLPFYGRDLVSTGLILTVAFGVPAIVRSFQPQPEAAPVRLRR
jgi:hypothetical protein